ncbi:MAG: glycosyltransferase [Aureliella sp.]
MIYLLLAIATFLLALLPAAMVFKNLQLFSRAEHGTNGQDTEKHPVSVLIPARNEAERIEATLNNILQSEDHNFELIVLDDHSEDQTPDMVRALSANDPRLRLEQSEPLPDGWNGKQHACWQLADRATHDTLVFLDADVHVTKDFVERCRAEFARANVSLHSGFPRQHTKSLGERLLIPMMHYVLLGYLPLDQMRKSNKASFGAGCGQLFIADKADYLACGGHSAIKNSRHDGLKLPRAFREAGKSTDLFDASDIASVRMYEGFKETVNGLLKNATEGIANSQLIFVFSILLIGGSVAPALGFAHALYWGWPDQNTPMLLATILFGATTLISFLPAFALSKHLGRPVWTTLLHPFSVTAFVLIQWLAFAREKFGLRAIAWKGRN